MTTQSALDLFATEPLTVRYGDVWQLGRHRIACRDAFDSATCEVLLRGVHPHCILTDPPYGMRLDTNFEGMRGSHAFNETRGVAGGHLYKSVSGDYKDFDASFFVKRFQDTQEQFWFGADYYTDSLGDTMHSGSWLVWDKRLTESADKMYGSCFELLWSKKKHKRDILRHKWAGLFGTEHEIGNRKRQHPTQKPLPLIEDILTRYTKPEQVILDMFLGSGTTIIACERTGRIAYGCELSPEYCTVTIQRWQALTNQRATLVDRIAESEAA